MFESIILFLMVMSNVIANPIAIASSDLDLTDLSNTDIGNDFDLGFSQDENIVADNACESDIPQDSSQAFQDNAETAIDSTSKNAIFKRGAGATCSAKTASPFTSRLRNYLSHYRNSYMPPIREGPSQVYPTVIDNTFEPKLQHPDDGCENYPNLKYHLTCGGPEIAHPNLMITSADFVINCVREIATEIQERFWYRATYEVAQYCCAFWKNSVSSRPV